MLKKLMLAIVPLALLSTTVFGNDVLNDVANLNVAAISDAPNAIVDPSAGLDFDGLANDAGSENSDEAIEACFRRFGYGGFRGCGWGHYGGFGHYGFGHCYPVWHNYCYQPVVIHTYRFANYWGCW